MVWSGGPQGHGEVTERPNVAVLKTAVRLAHRGFESLPLRCSSPEALDGTGAAGACWFSACAGLPQGGWLCAAETAEHLPVIRVRRRRRRSRGQPSCGSGGAPSLVPGPGTHPAYATGPKPRLTTWYTLTTMIIASIRQSTAPRDLPRTPARVARAVVPEVARSYPRSRGRTRGRAVVP